MKDDNLLFSRLRSVRSRKRTIRKDVEKQIRKKYKRSKELWKTRRNIPLLPLDQPYQRGFVRYLVLKDEVKRFKDGDFFKGILKKINTYMYSESRKFLKKKRKFGRRVHVEKEQKLPQNLGLPQRKAVFCEERRILFDPENRWNLLRIH
ncbi:MAG: hypothetical protein MUW56_09125 [Chryseobacterium sp.]|uniref:hypothetical protein n=1 Tax=Chryseobacterium sp. TaxID=1871047 RepID=UPI0025BE7C1E|nr:hypothetical protein [Chryseobacterium sp.]MCJ7933779.1 hypothetical protein [Chryseobacterium sp.]